MFSILILPSITRLFVNLLLAIFKHMDFSILERIDEHDIFVSLCITLIISMFIVLFKPINMVQLVTFKRRLEDINGSNYIIPKYRRNSGKEQ